MAIKLRDPHKYLRRLPGGDPASVAAWIKRHLEALAMQGFAERGLYSRSRDLVRFSARIRAIFRGAFEAAGLAYFNPHSLRNTLLRLGQSICQTPEDFKAWSQNLGHEKVLTTFTSYGQVSASRQGEIIKNLENPERGGAATNVSELARALARELKEVVTTS